MAARGKEGPIRGPPNTHAHPQHHPGQGRELFARSVRAHSPCASITPTSQPFRSCAGELVMVDACHHIPAPS
eukprot:41346-Eustigmatos_ZCMA.PRE.1